MDKHEACEHACQQAVDFCVWPERQCDPVCVYLKFRKEYESEQIASAQSEAAFKANQEAYR